MAGQHEDASFAVTGGSSLFTKAWVIGMADRGIKSFAVTLLLLLGGGAAGLNVLQVDWVQALGTAAGAVVLSVLTSVVSAFVGEPGTTSALPGGK
jgi:hypothetical protein